jgi:hypothetical protein
VEYYFQRAKELKLRAFAVTDHHNFDAIDEIEEIAKKYSGVGYILGAEMTAKSKFGLFDYVCLGIPSKPKSKLQNLFDRNLAMQLEWGKRFEEVLAEQGFTFTTQERKQLLEIYRPARVIAKQGITHVRNEILRNYFLEKGFIKDNDDYEKICSKVYSSNGDYDSLFFLEAKEVIDHIDNNPFNNMPWNLQKLSVGENLAKRYIDNPNCNKNQFTTETYRKNKELHEFVNKLFNEGKTYEEAQAEVLKYINNKEEN